MGVVGLALGGTRQRRGGIVVPAKFEAGPIGPAGHRARAARRPSQRPCHAGTGQRSGGMRSTPPVPPLSNSKHAHHLSPNPGSQRGRNQLNFVQNLLFWKSLWLMEHAEWSDRQGRIWRNTMILFYRAGGGLAQGGIGYKSRLTASRCGIVASRSNERASEPINCPRHHNIEIPGTLRLSTSDPGRRTHLLG